MTEGIDKLPLRFWEKVLAAPNGCWEWIGARRSGYGQIWNGGKPVLAHRLAYETLRDPIPPELECDHLCRNRACVNPSHIEPVSRQENALRGDTGINNSQKTHCPQGHAYDNENTYCYHGWRHCRTCSKEHLRRWRVKQREVARG